MISLGGRDRLGRTNDAVLAVGLVHAVGDEGHPGGAPLGDKDLEVGVAVQRPGGDQHGGSPLATEGGLHVVEHGPAGATIILVLPNVPRFRLSPPMCTARTSPAASAVAHRGSQLLSFQLGTSANVVGKLNALKPRPATRSTSATASSTDKIDTCAVGTQRLVASINVSFSQSL